jgi:hypothetical protein
MSGIQHIQEERHCNSQPTSGDIIKVAHFFEVFFLQHKFSGVQTKWHPRLSHHRISLGHYLRIN